MINDFQRATGAKTKIAAGLAAIALAGIGTSASAATFDFEAIADGSSFTATSGGGTTPKTGAEGNWNLVDGISGFGPIVGNGEGIVDDGITVRAVGLNSDNTKTQVDAFFDAGGAGLGVCSSSSCKTGVPGAITSDDNLNTDVESLVLNFSSSVKITDLKIRNAGHGLANGDFKLNGDTYTLAGGMLSALDLASISAAGSFTLNYLTDGPELYVSTISVNAVPIPAAAWLFGSALIGLAGVARKRKIS